MSRRWPVGRAAPAASWKRAVLAALVALAVGGLGWLYGTRFLAMHRLAREVAVLAGQASHLAQENQRMEGELAHIDEPSTVERLARESLGWGYPDEVLVILERR